MKRAAIYLSLLLILQFVAPYSHAQTQTTSAATNDVVVVLSFENTSTAREYNWVGESFADSLAELLNVPGVIIVSPDERELAYQRLGVPLTTLPSRATAIKLAREAKASMLVLGTYNITAAGADQAEAELRGTARVIRVNEGRLSGETMPDGVYATRQYDFGGSLKTLQDMQSRLAYDILYQRDRALPFSLNQFRERARKVPPRAFESYIKGIMTDDAEKKSAYLQNAMREYEKANAGSVYAQAAFELGNLYFAQKNWEKAAATFTRLQKTDAHYAEAAFYAALAFWRTNNLDRALDSLLPLTTQTPLVSVYTNAGAIAAQAARGEKRKPEREKYLEQSMTLLKRATESQPNDLTARFNYGYAFFIAGKYAEAADQLRPVIAANPRDGEALFMFSKSLERTGQAEAATAADNEARRYLSSYAKMQTEWQRGQTINEVPLRLQQSFNRFDFYGAKRIEDTAADNPTGANAQDLLAKAREMYEAGRDDEALPELRRVLTVEPMSAEAYLYIGRIYQRRGDLDAATSALKTAVFWDAKQIDAHILLGKIFLERGDRQTAMTYARNAMQIDPNNPEAIGLQRQIETANR